MNNIIHPTSIIGDNVVLGNNNYVGPYCYITSNTIIGDNNRFEAYCSIGTPAENKGYFDSFEGKTIIGNNNIIREYTSINAGSNKITIIGNNNLLLRNVYIAHDSVLEDNIILSGNVLIGGYTHIMEGINMGMGSICHQLIKIGAYSMIGMGAVITKTHPITPGGVYVGVPAKFLKSNTFGLKKHKLTEESIKPYIERYHNIKISR
jgi:UDP-N-acetylglucosamine acyltransferase